MFDPNVLSSGTVAMLGSQAPPALEGWLQKPEIIYPLGLSILLGLLAFILKAPDFASWWRGRHQDTVGTLELEQILVSTPMVIVDLRPPADFNGPKGHLRGSLNLPFEQVGRRIGEVAKDKRQLLVLVDQTDQLSHWAAPVLKAAGYQWVRVLKGGLRCWQANRLPVAVTGKHR